MRPAELTLRREDGRVVCESVRVADTTLRRLRGLLGRRSLPRDQGMLLRPAFSIHTWFMQFPIDVVFLDPEQVVIKIAESVTPFKTVGCRGSREVVELAAGECGRRGLALGDRVAWAAKSTWEPQAGASSALAGATVRATDGAVAVVSADPRFAKLARFLLENREFDVRVVTPADAVVSLEGEDVRAVVVDAGNDLPSGLRLVSGIRAATAAPIVLAREDSGGSVPGGFSSFHKWDDTEALVAAVATAALADGGDRPPVRRRDG